MLGIRGVGPRLAAATAAEVGEFTRFDDPDKLVSYAELFGIGKNAGPQKIMVVMCK